MIRIQMDDDDFGFGSDEFGSDNNDENAEIENKYYYAKSLKESNAQQAIQNFKEITEGEFEFKSKKQIYKCLLVLKKDATNELKDILGFSKTLMPYYFEKSINNLIDFTCQHASTNDAISLLLTIVELCANDNIRIWSKCHLKLAAFYLAQRNYKPLPKIFKQLQQAINESSESQATQALEVAALEIQYYSETKNNRKLKELYTKTLTIRSAIPHPRITGIIREAGGKMFCQQKDFDGARREFFESFKNYDEAGAYERIRVLKYLVLCNILSSSRINPFQSPETRPYATDSEVIGLTALMEAYQEENIDAFQTLLKRILHTNLEGENSYLSDPFIKGYIDDVLEEIRFQTILTSCEKSTSHIILFRSLTEKLHVSVDQLKVMLIKMILDQKLNAEINDSLNELHLTVLAPTISTELSKYSNALFTLSNNIRQKINSF